MGADHFHYFAYDGFARSDAIRVDITVTSGNNFPPTIIGPLSDAANEDAASFTRDLLSGASDPEGGALVVKNLTGLASGLTLSADGRSLTINPADASFQPLGNGQSRIVTLTYDIMDPQGGSTQQTDTVTINGINDAPVVAGPLSDSATEGAPAFTRDLLTGASDIEGAALSVKNMTGLEPGVTLGSDGRTLTIDPANPAFEPLTKGQTKIVTIGYDIVDFQGGAVKQTETITITGISPNAPPTVTGPLTDKANEDAPSFTRDLLSGASDPEGGTLSVKSLSGLVSGLKLDADGRTLTINPADASFQVLGNGKSTVIGLAYDITDPLCAKTAQTETVTIFGVNDNPTAVDDAGFSTSANTKLSIGSASLLGNDSDIDAGDTLAILSVQDAKNGSVVLGASGVVEFTPLANYAGSASFTYTVGDGKGGSANATANLTVNSAFNIITGTSGPEKLTGTSGADKIDGLASTDTINALGGDDHVVGGAGGDKVNGGDGNDTFYAINIAGSDGQDAYDGGAGNDTYDFSALTGNVTLRLGGTGIVNGVGGASGGGNALDTMLSIENAIGGSGSDTLWGDNLDNALDGGAGNDTVRGYGGTDKLTGGSGNDVLTGGTGDDCFIFKPGFGNDRIVDFDATPLDGQDVIELSGFGIDATSFSARVQIADVGADTLVTVDGDAGQTIRLTGVAVATTVTVDDFRFS